MENRFGEKNPRDIQKLADHELTNDEKKDISEASQLLQKLREVENWFNEEISPLLETAAGEQKDFEDIKNRKDMTSLIAKRKELIEAIRQDNQSEKLKNLDYNFKEAALANQFNLHTLEVRIKQLVIKLPPDNFHVPLQIQQYGSKLNQLTSDLNTFITYLQSPRRGLNTHERKMRLGAEQKPSTSEED